MKLKGILLTLVVFAIAGVGLIRWRSWSDKAETKSLAEQKESFKDRDNMLAALTREQQDLVNQMKPLAGNGSCDSDAECKVAPLGAKICEGYKDFLVYSTSDADEPPLRDIIRRFNSNQSKIHDLTLDVPSCGKATPTATCVAKRCTIQ